jgi:hypothetical protein
MLRGSGRRTGEQTVLKAKMNGWRPLRREGDNKMHGQRDLLDWQDRMNIKERMEREEHAKDMKARDEECLGWRVEREVEGHDGEYLLKSLGIRGP